MHEFQEAKEYVERENEDQWREGEWTRHLRKRWRKHMDENELRKLALWGAQRACG
jgi:hypothetical protein